MLKYSHIYFQVLLHKIYSCICNYRFQHIKEINISSRHWKVKKKTPNIDKRRISYFHTALNYWQIFVNTHIILSIKGELELQVESMTLHQTTWYHWRFSPPLRSHCRWPQETTIDSGITLRLMQTLDPRINEQVGGKIDRELPCLNNICMI